MIFPPRVQRSRTMRSPQQTIWTIYSANDNFMNHLNPEFQTHQTIQQQIGDRPFVLNISENLPRKQLDILLETYARLRYYHPELLLVRVGPEWEPEMQARIERLGIRYGIRLFSQLEHQDLVELYQRAAIVLITNDGESLDVPLVSDVPVLQEIQKNRVVYYRISKPDTITRLLNHLEAALGLSLRLKPENKHSDSNHSETIHQLNEEYRFLPYHTSGYTRLAW
ncbi:glycosyltransferase [Nostoc piscinale]|uniref:glycosyltransferase n=1 Tax=Nostoc piscinale TaxID=224012 RepID=UPI001910209A|nr:glycosyltransferase [Nostoc piscinale]